MKKLVKSKDKWLDGVLGGIAEYFGIDIYVLRLIFFIAFWIPGFCIPLIVNYIFLSLAIPEETEEDDDVKE
jgi:phage shock protein C